MSFLDRTFQLRARNTSAFAEIRGGMATFLAMAYILAANPAILSAAGVPLESAIACTALAAGICCIAMGLWANFPVALASGMGLNAVIAFQVSKAAGGWQTAMGLVVLDGVVVLLLVLMGLREAVLRAIPRDLRLAIGAGIGLFIAYIGLGAAGFVQRGLGDEPMTIAGPLTRPGATVAIVGLVVTAFLLARRVKGALLIGIIISTIVAAYFGLVGKPGSLHFPSFQAAFQADVVAATRGVFRWPLKQSFLPLLLSLLMVDFFDTLGTVTAIADEARLTDKQGSFPGLRRVLIVDSLSASVGGLLGCSSVTSYIESATGVAEGARTGLHTVVVGLLFLLAVFLAPLVAVVPPQATAPALILVGFFMIAQFAKVDFENLDTAIPAFITLIAIPLTFSISDGIGFGFITFVAIEVLSLRFTRVHPLMYLTAAAFVVYLVYHQA